MTHGFFRLPRIGVALALLALACAGQVNSVRASELLTVQSEGQGPDVVLIPGLASSREVWRPLADRLKATHRVHLVQLAGFAGEPAVSPAQDRVAAPASQALSQWLEKENIVKPTIIGHSLGGEVALMLAARHPELPGKLVIVDALPFYSLIFGPTATEQSAAPHAAAFRDAIMTASPEQMRTMQEQGMARLIKTESARSGPLSAALTSDKHTVATATWELMTTDLRPSLAKISAPVAVIYAWDASMGIPAQTLDTLYQDAYGTLPGVHFKRIDGSYHFIMIDQPEAFEQAVNAVLPK
nr:alpha/beta hydrolase [uncultured Enterobacter sp.]